MSKLLSASLALMVTFSFSAMADQPSQGRAPTEPARLQQQDQREIPALHVLPRPTQLGAPRSKFLS